MAEAKGKRLLIASESQQGARLDESMVKQLCSTDEVEAEKKYKDPFHFVPCHTLVLYTNYLPRVSGIDDGIWSRLFVIPFNNKLRGGKGDIKNYADFLFEHLTAVFHQTQGLFLLGRQPFLVLIFDSQIRVIGNLGALQGTVRGL